MRAQVITIATGDYSNYAYNFIESLNHFLPNIEKKLTLISDGRLDKYKDYVNGNIVQTDVIFTFNIMYPLINLNKPIYINTVIDKYCDYIFYFDIDTIFNHQSTEYWDNFIKSLDNGNVKISYHPFYALKDDEGMWGFSKERLISNFHTNNVAEDDKRFAAYIDGDDYDYVITSFWGARRDVMITFNERIKELMKEDLTRYPHGYHIPRFMDETYINKLVYDANHGNDKGIKYDIQQYCELNKHTSGLDSIFMWQKDMPDFKTNRR